ncbi:MAG TPA: hypothetical protein VN414_06605 [Methanosarcina sp.]|nr:hypothetical protein [Methanosarcina sp.]
MSLRILSPNPIGVINRRNGFDATVAKELFDPKGLLRALEIDGYISL